MLLMSMIHTILLYEHNQVCSGTCAKLLEQHCAQHAG